jgi:hypothetical protein
MSKGIFPNGDTRTRATNDVTANSRGHVNRRAQGTITQSAISTRDPDPYYNRAAWPHLHRDFCSFLMSCGPAARRG